MPSGRLAEPPTFSPSHSGGVVLDVVKVTLGTSRLPTTRYWPGRITVPAGNVNAPLGRPPAEPSSPCNRQPERSTGAVVRL